MAKVNLYNKTGQTVGEINLDPALFEVKADKALVHEAVVAQMANSRVVLAHTKDRGEVAGTGKKPWKQKGTGRARHGSRRSPIWVGGGVTFGPLSNRNFSRKLNRQARRKALAMVLSDKVANGNFIVIDSLDISEGKTKTLISVLKKLPVAGKKTLIAVAEKKNGVLVTQASRNVPKLTTLPADSLNVVDLLAHEFILVSEDGVALMVKTFKKK